MKSEKEINMIRGKMTEGVASVDEILEFLRFVDAMEKMLNDGNDYDVFGTQGWKYHMGWERDD